MFDIMREIVSVSLRYYFLLFNAVKVDKIVILSTIIFYDVNVANFVKVCGVFVWKKGVALCNVL